MRIRDATWMQLEAYLAGDDRAVLPLGSTEQHAYLSLATDAILAERVAAEAAEPLGVPVYPALPYGISPYFRGYPGTVSLRPGTYCRVIRDVLDDLHRTGFRRILVVNGHGGNAPAGAVALDWLGEHPESAVRVHDWWAAPRVWAKVREIDPDASHASWMESFPWTRPEGVEPPDGHKPPLDVGLLKSLPPERVRQVAGDGSYGGDYRRPPEDAEAVWRVAVDETRDVLEGGWA